MENKSNQHEILTVGQLLNDDGTLKEPGFSRHMITHYNREKIAKSSLKIKEWDYYLITNGKKGVALTVADNGYMGMMSVSVLNFENDGNKKPSEHTNSIMTLLPRGKFNLPYSSKAGTTSFSNKKCDFSFTAEPTGEGDKAKRILQVRFDNFDGKKTFTCKIELTDEPDDSMVIVTPYKEDDKAFYFNQKIVGMKASGWAQVSDKTDCAGSEDSSSNKTESERIEFDKLDATGLLDWGRGVWTPENTWYWGAASGYIDGHSFGWNIGYGFGDTTSASENMLFYDGIAHKLDRVKFNIPLKNAAGSASSGDGGSGDATTGDAPLDDDWIANPANPKKHLSEIHDFTKPWTFTSNDGRFEMNFTPIIDRNACIDFKILCSDQHQVFGKFDGKAILDDGKEITVKDFFGFAEKVHNKW